MDELNAVEFVAVALEATAASVRLITRQVHYPTLLNSADLATSDVLEKTDCIVC
jgi:hypothetical protein